MISPYTCTADHEESNLPQQMLALHSHCRTLDCLI